jgi:hypothetical protein
LGLPSGAAPAHGSLARFIETRGKQFGDIGSAHGVIIRAERGRAPALAPLPSRWWC